LIITSFAVKSSSAGSLMYFFGDGGIGKITDDHCMP
jgi:hypothetical protein